MQLVLKRVQTQDNIVRGRSKLQLITIKGCGEGVQSWNAEITQNLSLPLLLPQTPKAPESSAFIPRPKTLLCKLHQALCPPGCLATACQKPPTGAFPSHTAALHLLKAHFSEWLSSSAPSGSWQ